MPKIKSKRIGDIGIRLKPVEKNLLNNYKKIIKKTKKKKKKKKKKHKSKRTTKSVEIHKKVDPLYKIMEESKESNDKKEEKVEKDKKEESKNIDENEGSNVKKEESNEINEDEIKRVKVQNTPRDLTEKDSNIKTLNITVSTDPEPKKRGNRVELN